MLFDPGLDFDGDLKALNDLGGAPDGFHPAADPKWLLSALNRGGGQAFDFLAPDDGVAPPPIPTGFDLDLTDRKAADDFLLYGTGEPEPEPEPTPVDDVIVPGVRVIPGSTVGITIGDIPDLPYPPDAGGGGGGPPVEEDDDCPWNEAFDQLSEQLGHFKDGVEFLKDSWLVLDPRDDRALGALLINLQAIESGLLAGTISFDTVHDTISTTIEIALSEGTSYLGAMFGATVSAGFFGAGDGPSPWVDLIAAVAGGIAGVVADRTMNPWIADQLASLILSSVDIPEGMEGPCAGA